MSFWKLSTGESPTGSEQASFTPEIGPLPNNTQAVAQIKEFCLIQPTNTYPHAAYKIIYKITKGDFTGREVNQKIKCFDSKSHIADKGIEMLKRVYDLCNHKPTHSNTPSTEDLQPMIGKSLGIKIREYPYTKNDGTPTTGNFVAECYAADKDFITITGVKLELPITHETAFDRNPRGALPNDGSDIPF